MRSLPLLLALLIGCPAAGPSDVETEDPTPAVPMRATLEGTMTWTVDFDADAEAAGKTDCEYTRQYEGVEDLSAPWLCGSCDLLFEADVTMIDGRDECYSQVSPTDPAATEWIGFGGGEYYRNGRVQGSATDDFITDHAIADFVVSEGGMLSFQIDGEFTVGSEEGDVFHGVEAPEEYACGWPTSDAPVYDGNYVLEIGGLIPDGIFIDACSEMVRLHDFLGTYLVVDISAIDCPPCRTMAAAEGLFVQEMADEGIDVEVITLLAPSLSDTSGTPSLEQIEAWIEDFEVHAPVLGDRAWGPSVARPALAEEYAYPTSILVRPDGTVMEWRTGFGGFEPFAEAFRADAD
jgi:hypothetical protein